MAVYDVMALQKKNKASNFGKQLGAHVVNAPPAGQYTNPIHAASAPRRFGVAAQNQANYGPPDPWMHGGQLGRQQTQSDPNSVWYTGGSTGGSSDPGLDALRAGINAQIANLKSNAAYNKRQILLGFGSRALAQKSGLFTAAQLAAISDDPLAQTTLGRLNYGFGQQQLGFNESAGRGNVFYGGARGVGLSGIGLHHISDVDIATKLAQSQLDTQDQDMNNAINNLWIQYYNAVANSGSGSGA